VSIALPYAVPAASSWQVRSWRYLQESATVGADGTARIDFDQLPGDVMWLVERATSSCSGAAGSELRLYQGEPAGALLSGTSRGSFDEADYPLGMLVEPSTWLAAVWTGAEVGATAKLRIQVRELQQVNG
jgi:hypothetical protein